MILEANCMSVISTNRNWNKYKINMGKVRKFAKVYGFYFNILGNLHRGNLTSSISTLQTSKYLDLFKFSLRNNRKRWGICSKLTIKTEQHEQRRSGDFIVNFEHISYLFLVFLLLTLNRWFIVYREIKERKMEKCRIQEEVHWVMAILVSSNWNVFVSFNKV